MTVTYAPDVQTIPMFYECPRGCVGSAPSGRFVIFQDLHPMWRVEANTAVGVLADCPKCGTPMYARNWQQKASKDKQEGI